MVYKYKNYCKSIDHNIIKLYDQGKSFSEIGRILNIDRRAIRYALRKVGRVGKSYRENRGYIINELCFDEINEESAYWIGFLMADGYISSAKNCVRLDLQQGDYKHIEKFKKFVGGNQKIYYIDRKSTPNSNKVFKHAVFCFNSSHIVNVLTKYHFDSNKTLTAKTHNIFINNRDYFRGLIDGDGCLVMYRQGKYVKFQITLTGTLEICQSFNEFVHRIINDLPNTTIKKRKNIYEIVYSGRSAIKIIDLLYNNANIFLNRKKKIADRIYKQCLKQYGDMPQNVKIFHNKPQT